MTIAIPADSSLEIAVIGAGPAGLAAAEVLSGAGRSVHLFDAMPSVGRKFLLAGKGGLNLTHAEPFEAFAGRYGVRRAAIEPLLRALLTPRAEGGWTALLPVQAAPGRALDGPTAQAVQATLHLEHELVEVDAPFPGDLDAVEEEIHQHGLPAPDGPMDVEALWRRRGLAEKPRKAACARSPSKRKRSPARASWRSSIASAK